MCLGNKYHSGINVNDKGTYILGPKSLVQPLRYESYLMLM